MHSAYSKDYCPGEKERGTLNSAVTELLQRVSRYSTGPTEFGVRNQAQRMQESSFLTKDASPKPSFPYTPKSYFHGL